MSDKLVILSGPENDDVLAKKINADFINICETDWDIIAEKAKSYKQVILEHNSNEQQLYLLKTFANTYGFKTPVVESTFYVNTEVNQKIDNDSVLFIGCSHTAGEGHSNTNTVYTSQLCKLLGKKAVVNAHPGKGNGVTEEKLQTYDLKNANVVVQFTSIYRLYHNGINTNVRDFNRSQAEVFTDEILSSEFIASVKRIVKLLRTANAKFVFFHITTQLPNHNEITSLLSEYPEFLDMSNTYVDTGDLGHHFGQETHRLWAQKIMNSGLLS